MRNRRQVGKAEAKNIFIESDTLSHLNKRRKGEKDFPSLFSKRYNPRRLSKEKKKFFSRLFFPQLCELVIPFEMSFLKEIKKKKTSSN